MSRIKYRILASYLRVSRTFIVVNLLTLAVSIASASFTINTDTLDGLAKDPVPYMVSVQLREGKGYKHLCGGSIVHSQIVLTAAHCFHKYNNVRQLYVAAGSNRLDLSLQSGQHYEVTALFIHEQYAPLSGPDIALLRLRSVLPLDGAHLAKISYNTTEDPQPAWESYLIGWGRKQQLELVSFIALGRTDCQKRGFVYVTQTEMCAFSYVGRGACDGDSGGPLVNTDFNLQLAILSYGREPCKPRNLYVFTALYSMVDWITAHVEMLLAK